MASVTLTWHSQVTISREIREAVGIVEGDTVKMKVVKGDHIDREIEKLKANPLNKPFFVVRSGLNLLPFWL